MGSRIAAQTGRPSLPWDVSGEAPDNDEPPRGHRRTQKENKATKKGAAAQIRYALWSGRGGFLSAPMWFSNAAATLSPTTFACPASFGAMILAAVTSPVGAVHRSWAAARLLRRPSRPDSARRFCCWSSRSLLPSGCPVVRAGYAAAVCQSVRRPPASRPSASSSRPSASRTSRSRARASLSFLICSGDVLACGVSTMLPPACFPSRS